MYIQVYVNAYIHLSTYHYIYIYIYILKHIHIYPQEDRTTTSRTHEINQCSTQALRSVNIAILCSQTLAETLAPSRFDTGLRSGRAASRILPPPPPPPCPPTILTNNQTPQQTTQREQSISQHVRSCPHIHIHTSTSTTLMYSSDGVFLLRHRREHVHCNPNSPPASNSISTQTGANPGTFSESAHTFKTWEYINIFIVILI